MLGEVANNVKTAMKNQSRRRLRNGARALEAFARGVGEHGVEFGGIVDIALTRGDSPKPGRPATQRGASIALRHTPIRHSDVLLVVRGRGRGGWSIAGYGAGRLEQLNVSPNARIIH